LTACPLAGLRNVVVCFTNLLIIAVTVAVTVAVVVAATIAVVIAASRSSNCVLLLLVLDNLLLFISQHA
jgi:hypothetical protein